MAHAQVAGAAVMSRCEATSSSVYVAGQAAGLFAETSSQTALGPAQSAGGGGRHPSGQPAGGAASGESGPESTPESTSPLLPPLLLVPPPLLLLLGPPLLLAAPPSADQT